MDIYPVIETTQDVRSSTGVWGVRTLLPRAKGDKCAKVPHVDDRCTGDEGANELFCRLQMECGRIGMSGVSNRLEKHGSALAQLTVASSMTNRLQASVQTSDMVPPTKKGKGRVSLRFVF